MHKPAVHTRRKLGQGGEAQADLDLVPGVLVEFCRSLSALLFSYVAGIEQTYPREEEDDKIVNSGL
jgi:hypothetical protein